MRAVFFFMCVAESFARTTLHVYYGHVHQFMLLYDPVKKQSKVSNVLVSYDS